ncbi:MAG: nitroreductase family protein [Bacillota bacterium]
MELRRAIEQRRSIRSFKKESVSKQTLQDIINAAIWAPSGSNMQAWHFVVVSDSEQLEKVKLFAPGLFGDPPALIIISMDMFRAKEKAGKMGYNELVYYDAALAGQNMALLALEYGLGTCFIASFNKLGIKELLGLPEHILPYLIISIGYPDKVPPPPKRRGLSEIISWDKYEGS